MQQPNTVGDMFAIIGQAMKPYTELMELAAIWLDGKRYEKGERVNYFAGEITKNAFIFTHKIIKCMGTIDSSKLEMELENIETKERITIKL